MERSTVDTAGLFFAWLGHDIEEFVTMRETSRKLLGSCPSGCRCQPNGVHTGCPSVTSPWACRPWGC
jgi:hypothetical protein